MNPSYDVKIGGTSIGPAQADDMHSLETRVSMDAPADSFQIVLRSTSKSSQIKRSDPITVRLGYGSKQTSVFSGIVDAIEAGVSTVGVWGLSPAVKLLMLRIDQTYIGQTAGDIVRDLCNKASVPMGDVQDGVSLPSYFLSNERPAFDYVSELAFMSGYDVYFTPANQLVFRDYQPSTTHKLVFGEDVLKLNITQSRPVESVNVFGESPSSSRGSNTTHWLSKDDVKGTAGSGQTRLLVDPTVKDTSTANTVAKSVLARTRETIFAQIVCTGRPDIKVGEGISLQGFPSKLLNGAFKVRTVEHSLDKRSGFKTRFVCSREV